MLRSMDLYSLCGDSGELDLIDRVAVAFVQDGEALVENGLALSEGLGGVPLIGDEGEAEVLGEAGSDVVLSDVVAVEVDTGQVSLSVLEAGNHEVVEVGVLVVALLVAETGQIVGVVFHGVVHVVVVEIGLVGEFLQLAGGFLEVSKLAGGCHEDVVGDLLVAVDVGVLWVDGEVLRSPPQERRVSVAMITPSLHLRAITDPPVTMGLVTCPMGLASLLELIQIIFKQSSQPQRNKFTIPTDIYFLLMDSRSKRGKSSHQGSLNKSFRIGGSLAEENDVRNFNRQRNNQSMAPSQPHRIELPLFFNTPSRTNDDLAHLNKSALEQERKLTQKVDNGTYVTVLRRLKDYEMLAFGCRRAGKVRDEGRSYYSIGVLYDNIKKYKKAIEYYLKFLQVCKSINDSHGEALAYNCIGVDYQLLGETDSELTRKAIDYHNLHENLADINGKFLASINLGLCYDRLGDQKNSIYYFHNALKHSIQMSNINGQSVAVGNIGRIGTKDLSENKDKMKIFVQKYLKLSADMRDERGEMQGCLKLGMISSTKKNFEQGKDNFRRALELAEQTGNKQVYNQAKFGFAVVAAEKGMNNFLGYYSSKLNRRSEQ